MFFSRVQDFDKILDVRDCSSLGFAKSQFLFTDSYESAQYLHILLSRHVTNRNLQNQLPARSLFVRLPELGRCLNFR